LRFRWAWRGRQLIPGPDPPTGAPLLVAAIAVVIALVAATRGRNRPDVPLTSENDAGLLR